MILGLHKQHVKVLSSSSHSFVYDLVRRNERMHGSYGNGTGNVRQTHNDLRTALRSNRFIICLV